MLNLAYPEDSRKFLHLMKLNEIVLFNMFKCNCFKFQRSDVLENYVIKYLMYLIT